MSEFHTIHILIDMIRQHVCYRIKRKPSLQENITGPVYTMETDVKLSPANGTEKRLFKYLLYAVHLVWNSASCNSHDSKRNIQTFLLRILRNILYTI